MQEAASSYAVVDYGRRWPVLAETEKGLIVATLQVEEWRAECLSFRDYLRGHSGVAVQYEQLKRDLIAKLAHDPPAYNAAKGDFIQGVVRQACRSE